MHFSEITSLQVALNLKGETMEQFNERTANLSDDTKAYEELKVIALAYNDGKPKDYKDASEWKYFPWFNSVGSRAGFSFADFAVDYSRSYVGARLLVGSAEKAEHFGRTHLAIWDRYLNG